MMPILVPHCVKAYRGPISIRDPRNPEGLKHSRMAGASKNRSVTFVYRRQNPWNLACRGIRDNFHRGTKRRTDLSRVFRFHCVQIARNALPADQTVGIRVEQAPPVLFQTIHRRFLLIFRDLRHCTNLNTEPAREQIFTL